MASLTKDEKRFDRVFSKWVRYSAADKQGLVRCYTCGKIGEPANFHAGHYIDRTHKSTRWLEKNVKPQCVSCNTFGEGKKDEYALALIREYGEGILEELNSLKWTPVQLGELQVLGLIAEYEEKLKQLSD